MQRYIIPIAILLSSLLFIFVIPTENYWMRLTFKILPMILIIVYAFSQKSFVSEGYKIIVLIGLIFCTLGDAFIISSFIFGLGSFLIGHLFYIGAFTRVWHFSWAKCITIIPIAVYALFFGSKLITSLSQDENTALIIPVIIYICAIALMGWTAIMTGNKFAMIGSILFIISDTILSWDMFVSEVPYGSELIMLTYYSAQFLIASSIYKKEDFIFIRRY